MVEVISPVYERFCSSEGSCPLSGRVASTPCTGEGVVWRGLNLMKSEAFRLQSYRNWPSYLKQKPESLAKAGLFYTGKNDRVKCPFCLGVLKKWEPFDDPISEHRKLFPHCEFVLGYQVGNIPLLRVKKHGNKATRENYRKDGGGIDPHRVTHKQTLNNDPHSNSTQQKDEPSPTTTLSTSNNKSNPLIKPEVDFTKEQCRLGSFRNWPPNVSQTPESLAHAGFYHYPCEGKPDRVRCAYCQGKLYNWRGGDDPMIEHARCFPGCPYIKLCMGEQLIDDLIHQHEQGKEFNEQKESTELVSPPRDVSPLVCAVFEMGFSETLVSKVTEEYTEVELSNVTVSQLVEQLLDTERETALEVTRLEPIKVASIQGVNDVRTRSQVEMTSSRFRTSTRLHSSSNTSLVNKCVFLPCGHHSLCGHCYLSTINCPQCGVKVTGTVFM